MKTGGSGNSSFRERVLRSKKLLKHLITDEPTAGGTVGLASIDEQEAIDKWRDNDEALFFELIIHTSGTACS
jgi:hypothetical protein